MSVSVPKINICQYKDKLMPICWRRPTKKIMNQKRTWLHVRVCTRATARKIWFSANLLSANKVQKVQKRMKSRAKILVNTAFSLKYATPCKLVCKCNIYHLCLWFPPLLYFFFFFLHYYLPRANLCNLILRDENWIARQKWIKDLTQIKHRPYSGLLYVCLPKQRDEAACYSCILLLSLREELKASLKVRKSYKDHG